MIENELSQKHFDNITKKPQILIYCIYYVASRQIMQT